MATSWRCVLISYFAPFKIFWLTIITDIRASSTLGPLVIFIQGRLTGCSAKSRSLSRTFLENALQERELQMYFLRLLHTPRVCPAVARHMGCLAGHRHISVMHIELNALIFRSASARSGYNSQNDEPSASSIAVAPVDQRGSGSDTRLYRCPFSSAGNLPSCLTWLANTDIAPCTGVEAPMRNEILNLISDHEGDGHW